MAYIYHTFPRYFRDLHCNCFFSFLLCQVLKGLHPSLHVFVAVQLLLQHIWCDLNNYLRKVWELIIYILFEVFLFICEFCFLIFSCLLACAVKQYAAALESLRDCCEFVSPNDNFLEQVREVLCRQELHVILHLMHYTLSFSSVNFIIMAITFAYLQLKMFEEMNFKVDRGNPKYKRFRLRILGRFSLLALSSLYLIY